LGIIVLEARPLLNVVFDMIEMERYLGETRPPALGRPRRTESRAAFSHRRSVAQI
jgi:hypothetical protein